MLKHLLRFSLARLFLLMTLVCCFIFWRSKPSMLADKFVQAVESSQYSDADLLFNTPKDTFLGEWTARHQPTSVKVAFEKQSIVEWLSGKRRGRFRLSSVGFWSERSLYGELIATAAGIHKFQCCESHIEGLGTAPLVVTKIPDN